MKHCLECGSKLESREHEEEGLVPYCVDCDDYRFPVFNTAVSMIVRDEQDRVLLIEQYGREGFILVAGYISCGDGAEETVIREVKEETNLDVVSLQFNRSEYFERSNTLMLNFTCVVRDGAALKPNHEIDHAQWFTLREARENIRPGSLAQRFLEAYAEDIS